MTSVSLSLRRPRGHEDFKSPCSRLLAPCACLFLTLLCLAGCEVNQQTETKVYRDVLTLTPPVPNYVADQPLTLGEALALANEHNENLGVTGEAFLRTFIERKRTVANFLPTIDLTGDYTRHEYTTRDSPNEITDTFGNLEVNLFNGFRDVNRYWRDTWRIVQSRNDLLDAQESLLIDVARLYYLVLRSEASVVVLENSLKVQEQRLQDARGRFQAGLTRPLDVAQTESQVSATRTLLIDARNDVRVSRALLALLVGVPLQNSALADSFIPPQPVHTLDEYQTVAAGQRNSLRAAEAAVTAARYDVEVAFGQYYPSITLDITGYLTRQTFPRERDWDALLVATIPIFSAGRIHADVRDAWSFVRQAALVRSFLSRQIDQEVEVALQRLHASEARLAEITIQRDAAAQAFNQADQSYQVGLATNLERVTAQDDLLEAQLRLASEEFNRKIFFLELLRASGRLREELGLKIPLQDQVAIEGDLFFPDHPADAPAVFNPDAQFQPSGLKTQDPAPPTTDSAPAPAHADLH